MALLLAIRFRLARENRRRDAEPVDGSGRYDEVFIERTTRDGVLEKVKVDKVRFFPPACFFFTGTTV